MQAFLRSSLPNAESEDGVLGFIWFGNFWWKYYHCRMSVLSRWFCKVHQLSAKEQFFAQGWKQVKNMDPVGLASYQVGHCALAWFEWETWTLVSSCQPNQLATLFGDFLWSTGKSRAFPSLSQSQGLTRTVQDKSSKLNLPWPVEIICLVSSLPPFPKTVLEHQIHHTFSKYKVKLFL